MNDRELFLSLNHNAVKVAYWLATVDGIGNKDIGKYLDLSVSAVGTYVTQAYSTLEIVSTHHLKKRQEVYNRYHLIAQSLPMNPEDLKKGNWDELWNAIRTPQTPEFETRNPPNWETYTPPEGMPDIPGPDVFGRPPPTGKPIDFKKFFQWYFFWIIFLPLSFFLILFLGMVLIGMGDNAGVSASPTSVACVFAILILIAFFGTLFYEKRKEEKKREALATPEEKDGSFSDESGT